MSFCHLYLPGGNQHMKSQREPLFWNGKVMFILNCLLSYFLLPIVSHVPIPVCPSGLASVGICDMEDDGGQLLHP